VTFHNAAAAVRSLAGNLCPEYCPALLKPEVIRILAKKPADEPSCTAERERQGCVLLFQG